MWGTGRALREFIYSEDVAKGMLHMVKNKVSEPVNLGSGTGVSIKEVAEIIANHYNQEIDYDTTKPNGDMRRQMDTTRMEEYGFRRSHSLEVGIKETIEYYESIQ